MSDQSLSEFDDLALPHMNSMLRAALAISGRMDMAEDLTQTAFVKALQNFDRFQRGSNCKAWLLGILRNSWIDYLRRQKVSGKALSIEDFTLIAKESSGSPGVDVTSSIDKISDPQVIQALSRLPEEQRLTLYLVDVEEMSCQEVSEITGVPVGTVKSRASNGRAALRETLAAYAQEMGFAGRRNHASNG